MGIYLYCISQNKEFDTGVLKGVNNLPVKRRNHKDVSVLYSECEEDEVMPTRRNLIAHQKVGEELLDIMAVIPMKYGICARDLSQINDILDSNYQAILDQISHLYKKREFTLRITFNEPDIFDHINKTYPQIVSLRNRLERKGNAGYNERLELGKQVEAALEREKENVISIVKKHRLEDVSHESTSVKAISDLNVYSEVFLLEEDSYPLFEERVEQIADKLPLCKSKLVGPAPASHFVGISLS